MDLQRSQSDKGLRTKLAVEARVFLVNRHVLPDVRVRAERLEFAALEKTLEHPRLRRRVQFYVHLHVIQPLHAPPAPQALVKRVSYVTVDVAQRRQWRALAANSRDLLSRHAFDALAQFAPPLGDAFRAGFWGEVRPEIETRSVGWMPQVSCVLSPTGRAKVSKKRSASCFHSASALFHFLSSGKY